MNGVGFINVTVLITWPRMLGRTDYPLRACCCSLAKAARGRASNFSRPVVASQRYTLAAETSSCRANLATERPSCLRTRATDLPVGRIFGVTLAESPAGAGPSVADSAGVLRTAASRFALLEALAWPLAGVRFRRAMGRGFLSDAGEAARLAACRCFFVSVIGAGCVLPATSRSMPKMSPS